MPKIHISFKEACKFVYKLKLKNKLEWRMFCTNKLEIKKPENIPKCPDFVYKNKGWINWEEWLGIPKNKDKPKIEYLSFEEAQKLARKLKLKNQMEWHEYCNKNKLSNNIPINPNDVYKDKGWGGWKDFLGTGKRTDIKWMPYEEAKKFTHNLKLKSGKEWYQYCKGEFTNITKKPENLPTGVERTYKGKGWSSWYDFLGKENTYNKISFNKAKNIVRKLNIKKVTEYFKYYDKYNLRQKGIPKQPHTAYKNTGWTNWYDFLGKQKKN